jgi:L-fucose mutarotase/ribose pyranase (RbsD/FucU family)
MAVESSTQAQYIRDVENLRLQIRNATNSIVTTTEGNVRNAIVQRVNLDAKISEDAAIHAAAYGDGSAGTVAKEISAEITAANVAVDAVVGVTGKTRSKVEAEIQPV